LSKKTNKELRFNNRSLSYEKPKKTIWTDKLIQHIIDQLKKGFTYPQIEKELDVNKNTIKTIMSRHRKKSEWAGKIPYIKINQRPILVEQSDRVGILDIEFATFGGNRFHQINARLGCILCYVLKEYKTKQWYSDKIKFKDLRNPKVCDRPITENLIKDISRFDIIVGFYSSGCDLPFVRTRAMMYDIPFPAYGTMRQIDLWSFTKHKLLLAHNSLRELSLVMNQRGKDNLQMDAWYRAVMFGSKKDLDNIYNHCVGDVQATEGDFSKCLPYLPRTMGLI